MSSPDGKCFPIVLSGDGYFLSLRVILKYCYVLKAKLLRTNVYQIFAETIKSLYIYKRVMQLIYMLKVSVSLGYEANIFFANIIHHYNYSYIVHYTMK